MDKLVEEFFDQALLLEEGEIVFIPCEDKSQCESLRVNLYRQRRLYTERVDPDAETKIGIARDVIDGKKGIKLYKKQALKGFKILRKEEIK